RELRLQLGLGEPALGGVTGNLGGPHNAALSVPDRGNGDGHVDSPSAFCEAHCVKMIGLLSARNASQYRGFLVGALRRDQQGHWFAQYFRSCVTKQTLCARIPTRDNALES